MADENITQELCIIHQRPAYLWGGDTCDLCDLDFGATNDPSKGMFPLMMTREQRDLSWRRRHGENWRNE